MRMPSSVTNYISFLFSDGLVALLYAQRQPILSFCSKRNHAPFCGVYSGRGGWWLCVIGREICGAVDRRGSDLYHADPGRTLFCLLMKARPHVYSPQTTFIACSACVLCRVRRLGHPDRRVDCARRLGLHYS